MECLVLYSLGLTHVCGLSLYCIELIYGRTYDDSSDDGKRTLRQGHCANDDWHRAFLAKFPDTEDEEELNDARNCV